MDMKIINRKNVTPIQDTCGELYELHNSENLSVSYAIMNKDAIPHKHLEMEEVYYIVRGKAKIQIDEKEYEIIKGDTFSIPKGSFHHVKSIEEDIELVVITHPKFNKNDVILKN